MRPYLLLRLLDLRLLDLRVRLRVRLRLRLRLRVCLRLRLRLRLRLLKRLCRWARLHRLRRVAALRRRLVVAQQRHHGFQCALDQIVGTGARAGRHAHGLCSCCLTSLHFDIFVEYTSQAASRTCLQAQKRGNQHLLGTVRNSATV
jgi:hypothetical protein